MTTADCPTSISPEAPCVILADYYMEVDNLGFFFVAAIPATVQPWGLQFDVVATQAAWRRAASTLAQMGLIRGYTFQFMRVGAALTEAQAATLVGATVTDIQDWEDEAIEIPRLPWIAMADEITRLDGRGPIDYSRLCPPNYRARVIRVYPDIPQTPNTNMNISGPGPCLPCP